MNTVKSWKRNSQKQKIEIKTRGKKIHNQNKRVNRSFKKKYYWKIKIIKNRIQKKNRKIGSLELNIEIEKQEQNLIL